MEINECLKELSCSKSNVDQHFVKEPIALDCGHCICKSCSTKLRIKCNKCGEINKRDLKDAKELVAIKKIIAMYLPNLLNDIEQQTTESVAKLNSLLQTGSETIDLHINYVEEEVEIKIESMKIELDQIHEKFKLNLETLRKEIKERQSMAINMSDFKLADYENSLKELRNDFQKNIKQEDALYHHQDVLLKLKEAITHLEVNLQQFQVHFEPSTRQFDEKAVGEVCFRKMKFDVKKIKESIESGLFIAKQLPNRPYDSCVLPNNSFICSNENNTLMLFDASFNLLKTVDELNKRDIYPHGIAFDEKNSKIYVVDDMHQIQMLDLKLNLLKSVGSRGDGNHNLNSPKGIGLTNGYLYVADHHNSRIQILSADLEYVDTIKVNYQPRTVKVINSTIGVCGSTGTYFYDINSKAYKAEYPGILGRINEINSQFYVFSCRPKKTLFVYDADGALIEEINIDGIKNYILTHLDGNASIVNNNLIVTSFHAAKVFKFPLSK